MAAVADTGKPLDGPSVTLTIRLIMQGKVGLVDHDAVPLDTFRCRLYVLSVDVVATISCKYCT